MFGLELDTDLGRGACRLGESLSAFLALHNGLCSLFAPEPSLEQPALMPIHARHRSRTQRRKVVIAMRQKTMLLLSRIRYSYSYVAAGYGPFSW